MTINTFSIRNTTEKFKVANSGCKKTSLQLYLPVQLESKETDKDLKATGQKT